MHEGAIAVMALDVNVGASGQVVWISRANFEIHRYLGTAILQMVPIASSLRKGRTVTWLKQRFALVLDERQLAF